MNRADLPTRVMTAEQYQTSQLWHHGPQWLPQKDAWPTWEYEVTLILMAVAKEEEEIEPIQQTSTSFDSNLAAFIDISRFSSLQKLLRVTSYVLRFVSNCKREVEKQDGLLKVDEIHQAEKLWINSCQHGIYHEELSRLKTKGSLPAIVRQLRLFIDSDGLLRSGGRIHNAPLSEEAKFPILLPQRHPFTRLIIEDCHRRQLHAGVSTTGTALRQKFWIPSIRRNVQMTLRKYVKCKKVVGRPYIIPDPPPLPKFRVEDVPVSPSQALTTPALYKFKTQTTTEQRHIYAFLPMHLHELFTLK